MADNEMAELHDRARQATIAAIQAATQLAGAAIQLRTAALRRAVEQSREAATQARAQTRAQHVADSAAWREAMRPAWWRTAGAEDIAAVWRAASTWKDVDPRAKTACDRAVERLAERGVHVDLAPEGALGDVAWLSDALDRAAALDDITSGRVFDELVDEQVADADAAAAADPSETATARAADDLTEAAADPADVAVTAPGSPGANASVVNPESVRAEAAARLERLRDFVVDRQNIEFSEPRPDSPTWAAYERQLHNINEAVIIVQSAENPAYGIRVAAEKVQGQMSVKLYSLADRIDPNGKGLTADAAEQVRVKAEERAARRVEVAARQEEIAGHVRSAWPADRAERVINSDAWAVLATKLDMLDREGYDVQALLRGVPDFVDKAHTPAAFTYRMVDDAVVEGRVVASRTTTEQDTAQSPEQERGAAEIAAEQNRAAAAEHRAERDGARDGARTDERDARAVQRDGQEQASASRTVVDSHVVEAGAGARAEEQTAGDRARFHDERAVTAENEAARNAARAAAKGYPQDTDTAVAQSAVPPATDGRGGAEKGAAAQRPATTRPVSRPAGRNALGEPGGR